MSTPMGRTPHPPRQPLALLLVCMVMVSCGATLPRSLPHPTLGQTASGARGFRLEPSRAGQWISVPAPGKVTVIDFWATACEPCIRAMPALERLWQSVDRAQVQVIGVGIDHDPATARRTMAEKFAGPVSFPMVFDGKAAKLQGLFRVGGRVPSTFVVDRRGRVRFYSNLADGGLAQVEQAVRALVAK